MNQNKKVVEVTLRDKTVRVSWYAGATDDAIVKAVGAALALPAGSAVVLRDSDGDVVAISDSLPSGLKLRAELASADAKPAPEKADKGEKTEKGEKPAGAPPIVRKRAVTEACALSNATSITLRVSLGSI